MGPSARLSGTASATFTDRGGAAIIFNASGVLAAVVGLAVMTGVSSLTGPSNAAAYATYSA
jgi:hypothetical protein